MFTRSSIAGRRHGVALAVAAAVTLTTALATVLDTTGLGATGGATRPRPPQAATHPAATHPTAAGPSLAPGAATRPAAGHPAVDGAVATAGPARPGAAVTVWQWPRRAWIAVPVATVWNRPGTDRPVDAAEMSASPQVDAWIGAMDNAQKLALDDLLETQALLDDPVTVVAHRGPWIRVLVDDQRGGVYPLGIAGWMPADQVTYRPPAAPAGTTPAAATAAAGASTANGTTAIVAVPRLTVGAMTLSYGTRLPVVGTGPATVTVATPAGTAVVPASTVRTAPGPGSGRAVVAEAEQFVGLPYLWAGTSAFGYDCSGLTYSVYRQFGVVLPRDAEDQSHSGRPVGRADLQPGDLVFFSFGAPADHTIDHVGIYAGGGMVIHAPHTGARVQMVALADLAPWWAGATRVLAGE